MKPLILAGLILFAATLAHAQTWQRVAYDDAGVAGKQPHLIEGDNWRFESPGTADEALRTCAFGTRVEFGYADLNLQAQYKAKLRFFSDAPREVRIMPGGVNVKLETGKPVEQEVNLPVSATLMLAVEKISGPNAVVSTVEILSTDPKSLGVVPQRSVSLLRLSPRPVSDEVIDLAGTWRFNNSNNITVPGEWVMQGLPELEKRPVWEYFDLKKDPLEMHNLYHDPSRQQEVAALKVKLRELAVHYKDAKVVSNLEKETQP